MSVDIFPVPDGGLILFGTRFAVYRDGQRVCREYYDDEGRFWCEFDGDERRFKMKSLSWHSTPAPPPHRPQRRSAESPDNIASMRKALSLRPDLDERVN